MSAELTEVIESWEDMLRRRFDDLDKLIMQVQYELGTVHVPAVERNKALVRTLLRIKDEVRESNKNYQPWRHMP